MNLGTHELYYYNMYYDQIYNKYSKLTLGNTVYGMTMCTTEGLRYSSDNGARKRRVLLLTCNNSIIRTTVIIYV